MKFSDLDKTMRLFETNSDTSVLPGIYMIARLDGRGFTRLTKEVMKYQAPFDEAFRDCMIQTTNELMQSDIRFLFGYTQSDEISLLFDLAEETFGRKIRKLNSILAGIASASFSLRVGRACVFDCRISQLPSSGKVLEYFRWRQADAHRNALSAHAYWALRRGGSSATEATCRLMGANQSNKQELLFQSGINYNELPLWQKRGVGIFWKKVPLVGKNQKTGEIVDYTRWRLTVDLELPFGLPYQEYIRNRLMERRDSVSKPLLQDK